MTLKTPNLFDVPRDRPTAMERLEAFKERYGIFTWGDKNDGWDAMLVNQARALLSEDYPEAQTADAAELIMDYCRLIEDVDLLVSRDTEREAIEELCRLNKIPFKP